MIKIKTYNFLKISQSKKIKHPKIDMIEQSFNNIMNTYNTLRGAKNKTKLDQSLAVLGGVKLKFWGCAKDEVIKNIRNSLGSEKQIEKRDEDAADEMIKLFQMFNQEIINKYPKHKDLAFKSPEINPMCGIDYVRKNPHLYAAISNFGK